MLPRLNHLPFCTENLQAVSQNSSLFFRSRKIKGDEVSSPIERTREYFLRIVPKTDGEDERQLFFK
jgi:hypothetical protein